jgi:VWFA-related protein
MRTASDGGILALACAAALLSGGAPALSAQQPRAEQAPSFRSGVEVVSLDVGVVDKQGMPIRGLTPADFVVTVAGQQRRIVTAEFISRDATPASARVQNEGATISTNEGAGIGRLYAFVVDQNTLDLGSARRVSTAANPFFSRLTFSDRTALTLLPVGPNIQFTWAHDSVQQGLQRVAGMSRPLTGWEYGSLADARDITNRNMIALRNVGERECGSATLAGGFGAPSGGGSAVGATSSPAPTPSAPPSGGGTQGGETGGSSPSPAPSGSAPSASPAPRASTSSGAFGSGSCTREIQMQAESTWRSVVMTSMQSIHALRQALAGLAQVRGDKTVILISGGWPMDEREEMSTLNIVASEAAAARATIFSIYVPVATFTADRRLMTATPLADSYLHSSPLETLAAMTGGGSFRAEVGADAAFERLGRELSGFYRLAIEKDPSDVSGKDRHMKVQVSRSGTTVRAREVFDVHTYEDRDWAARLGSAMEGPVTATEIGLRVTNYLSPDFENPSKIKLLISGEASRIQNGDATVRMLVSDLLGKRVAGGDMPLTHSNEDTLPFSTNVSVPPGSYIVRVAVMDSGGRVGSVDHRADARDTQLGPLSAMGPVLVRVPRNDTPYLALDSVRQDERLALELDLEGDATRLESTDVEFEIASTADGPALIRPTAAISRTTRQGSALAQSVADMRVLPAGTYVVRAKVTAGNEPVGEVLRKITVIGTAGARTEAAPPPKPPSAFASSSSTSKPTAPHPVARMPISAAPGFTLDQVLAPQILNPFLERAAARPDASAPGVKELLEKARTSGLKGLEVPDSMAKTTPVAGFLKGLTLLSESQTDQKKLEPAATEFKSAMNRALDFYAPMIYLGASFAANGKDKEAAAIWRTALIKEGDAASLHVMLADAQLRQGRGDLAVDDLAKARERWPDDAGLTRRFAVSALLSGQRAEGLKVLDELIDSKTDDETSLTVGLLVLYDAFESHEAIETAELDRVRMQRLADTYRAHGYASQALVDTWVTTAAGRKQ